MKVLAVLDSFKGSLSSLDAGTAVIEGVKRVYPESENKVLPIADGGEGSVDALVYSLGGKKIKISVSDPLGRAIECEYGVVNNNTAVIEMSCAAGITLLSDEEKNPMQTSTFGVGEVIKHAALNGCTDFIIGIGGSATNDGGIGMLQALGFGILDKNGNQVRRGAMGLKDVCCVSTDFALGNLKNCTFRVACDVTNPLCGKNGCSAVYGPQKGADDKMITQMDNWLDNYASVVKKTFKNSDKNAKGAGAAGGMGFALMSFLGAELVSGINLILDTIKIEEYIQKVDIIVTGEGRLDSQSVNGKVPIGVANAAKKHLKPVIAFCGSVSGEAHICNSYGIDAYFPVLRQVTTLENAMDRNNAYTNLCDTSEQVFRLIKATTLNF